MRHQVTLQQESALGNGKRLPGTVLGYLDLADGVELVELLTGVRNPRLISIGGVREQTSADVKAEADRVAAEDAAAVEMAEAEQAPTETESGPVDDEPPTSKGRRRSTKKTTTDGE